ncbi:MAG: pseudouridine synthase [Terriglobia bacterium]
MRERLQKLLARAGVASRRTAENLIRAGAVRVNGRVVTRLGVKADPVEDRIEVEGRRLRFPDRPVHLLFNKPRGTVSTAADPEGRPTVFDGLKGVRQRVFTVGRLPYEVEGLLLVTSDGAFADRLLRGRLPQTYWVKVKGRLSDAEITRLEKTARNHQAVPLGLRQVKPGANPWYEVCLAEPREDWLRTAFFRLGYPVEKVKRVAIGSLRAPSLPPGRFRELTDEEVEQLVREANRASSAEGLRPRRAGLPAAGRLTGKLPEQTR